MVRADRLGNGCESMKKDRGDRLPVQRQAEIFEFVKSRETATISEIVEAVEASASTVRRDLKVLASQDRLQLSHGGATIKRGTTFEPRFEDRRRRNPEAKAAIAGKALEFVEPGASVIFDSSSTVLAVAELLRQKPIELSAVTNDVAVAVSLSEADGVSVVVPGGQVRKGSFTLLGSHTEDFFARLHADVLLLGIHAISEGVLTDASLEIVHAKRTMISAAQRTILLADHEKFGSPAFFEVGGVDLVDDLVTDAGVQETTVERIREAGETRIHVV